MKFPFTKRNLVVCAFLGAAVCGQYGFAAPPPVSNSAADEEIRQRVQTALHSDPYFYDAHVTVSMDKGDVVLQGFVFTDWDLRDAMRIAGKAAGETRVIDNLSIKLGGRR